MEQEGRIESGSFGESLQETLGCGDPRAIILPKKVAYRLDAVIGGDGQVD